MVRLTAITAALALLAGVLLVQWLPQLPPRWSVACLLVLAAALFLGYRPARWLACVLLGIAWACWRASVAMDARLPHPLEGVDLTVVGTVADLPMKHPAATRFTLNVTHATLDGEPVRLHGRVTVSWYQDAPVLQPCSRWHLVLRLKRPRALINPSGADSERSALERGIVATGYVRDDPDNASLGDASWCVNTLREAVAEGIAARVPDQRDAALLRAFAVGDTRGLEQHDWAVARANGVSHLIAISGFHVGVAAVFGIGLIWLVYACWPRFGLRLPRTQAQAGAALLVAFAYSAMAGFGLPTVRTLLMICVVAMARCNRRGGSGAHSLALAMIAIVLVDPLAVLSAGFWLSFVGVAFLMLCLQARGHGLRAFFKELSSAQLVMTLALLPLTLWFFGQASLIGALSNLVAVPVVSFLIVPCALFGMVLLGLCPPLAEPVLWLAARIVHGQWWLLEQMATWPGAHWYLPTVHPHALLLAVLGSLWVFLPRGVPLRSLGLLLFVPLLWPPLPTPPAGAFHAWVLDVGQGLSVLVRTRHHVLVYDAGARYPSGFDLGEAVVLPSIHALGLSGVDMLIVSHGDNDHAGGAAAVVRAFPAAVRYAGEPARMRMPTRQCVAGKSWRWDGVQFDVIAPDRGGGNNDNDSSCVLLVTGIGGRLLLTGDISSRVEPQVAATIGDGPPLFLLVPHHGSKTSSSGPFIAAVGPELAVVSAGWRNRFGHPRPEVLGRYAEAGVPLLNTATQGAIGLDFPTNAPPRAESGYRQRRRRYWRE